MSRLEDGFKATIQPVLEEHTTRQDYEQIAQKVRNLRPINFEGIPSELRSIPQWVGWKYGPGDKRPIITPRTGRAASVTDPSTWGTFEEVRERKEAGLYHGIGFVLTKDLGITAIDLDHCISANGLVDEWAWDIVTDLWSYTEISPSGTGYHIFVYGNKPGDEWSKRGDIEIYDHAKFISVTGHRVDSMPLGLEDTGELSNLYYEHVKQRAVNPVAAPRTKYSPKTDSEVIEKLRTAKNAWKSWPLWEGQWKGQYPSQSDADRQLVLFLLYWTGYDLEQTDKLFRQSGLMRAKWDEPRGTLTYGERTIQNALQARG